MKKKLLALLLCVAMLLPSIAYAAPLGGINFSASAVKDLVSSAADEVEEETPVEEEPVVETPVVEEIPTSENKDSLLGKISAATVKSLVDEVSVQATEDSRAEDIYSQMMEANDLDSYGKISSTLNEIKTIFLLSLITISINSCCLLLDCVRFPQDRVPLRLWMLQMFRMH